MFLRFLKDEQGQDIIECVLLMTFVVLVLFAFFIASGGTIVNGNAISSYSRTIIQILSWITAGVVVVIFLNRRRNRNKSR